MPQHLSMSGLGEHFVCPVSKTNETRSDKDLIKFMNWSLYQSWWFSSYPLAFFVVFLSLVFSNGGNKYPQHMLLVNGMPFRPHEFWWFPSHAIFFFPLVYDRIYTTCSMGCFPYQRIRVGILFSKQWTKRAASFQGDMGFYGALWSSSFLVASKQVWLPSHAYSLTLHWTF